MKKSFFPRAILILASALMIACEYNNESYSSNDTASSINDHTGFIQCEDERPTACTYIYKPVCASVDTGIRCVTTPCPSVEFKTYGNACSACADSAVDGFTEGECPSDSNNSPSDPSDTQGE